MRPLTAVRVLFFNAGMSETFGSWPYQVAIADDGDAVAAATAYSARHRLSLRVMGPQVVYEQRQWAVFCFGRFDDAELFRQAQDGRWVHAHLWRRDGAT